MTVAIVYMVSSQSISVARQITKVIGAQDGKTDSIRYLTFVTCWRESIAINLVVDSYESFM